MKKGKYMNARSARRSGTKRLVALTLAMVLLIGGAVGGTLAWLTATTNEVKNTFTTSDINITLAETKKDFKMIPGWTIEKDPIVTVQKGSEDAWVFIKVEEKGGNVTVDGTTYTFDDFIAYQIDTNNWTPLSGEDGVYYTKYENRDDVDIAIKVLAGGSVTLDGVEYKWEPNQVLTKPTVTKEMMNAIVSGNKTTTLDKTYSPNLTFTAYATQYWQNNTTRFEPADAWNLVKPTT